MNLGTCVRDLAAQLAMSVRSRRVLTQGRYHQLHGCHAHAFRFVCEEETKNFTCLNDYMPYTSCYEKQLANQSCCL